MKISFIRPFLLILSVPFIIAPACGSLSDAVSVWTNPEKMKKNWVRKPHPKPAPAYSFKSTASEVISIPALKNKLRFRYLVTINKGTDTKKLESWTNLASISFTKDQAFNSHLKIDAIEDGKVIFQSQYRGALPKIRASSWVYFDTPAENNCTGTRRCSKAVTCDVKTSICKKEIIIDVYIDSNFKGQLPDGNLELLFMVTKRETAKYRGASLSVVQLK